MSESNPDNTMRERVGNRRGRFRLYILLNANRSLLTAVLTLGTFVVLVILGAYAVPPFRVFMRQYAPTRYIFQAFVTALITGVTLVVSINQLVLSQELGPLNDQRGRMGGTMSFRADIEEIFDTVSPPEPSAFLRALVENTGKKAEIFRETISDNSNDDLVEQANQLADSVTDNAEVVSDELEDRDFGEYTVVRAALDYNYSWKVYRAKHLQRDFKDDLNDDERRALIDLISVLAFFGPAREHIKTLYFQWELVNLSRGILYTSIPALVSSAALATYLAPASFSGATFGIGNLVWIVSAGITVASVPFFFLSVEILRLATLAKRTLAIGPLILRDTGRSNDIEWK
jgi:hypothetical protein